MLSHAIRPGEAFPESRDRSSLVRRPSSPTLIHFFLLGTRRAGTAANGNDNADAQEEVLVAIGDLSGAYPAPHAWIGMNDAEEEGTYVWSSGEPVTYFEPSKDNQFTGDGLTWTAEYSGGPASWQYKNEDYVGIQRNN